MFREPPDNRPPPFGWGTTRTEPTETLRHRQAGWSARHPYQFDREISPLVSETICVSRMQVGDWIVIGKHLEAGPVATCHHPVVGRISSFENGPSGRVSDLQLEMCHQLSDRPMNDLEARHHAHAFAAAPQHGSTHPVGVKNYPHIDGYFTYKLPPCLQLTLNRAFKI